MALQELPSVCKVHLAPCNLYIVYVNERRREIERERFVKFTRGDRNREEETEGDNYRV